MSVLSRQTIAKFCDEFSMVHRHDNAPLRIEPVSIDIHLDQVYLHGVTQRRGFVELLPGTFCLGGTIEIFNMPHNVVGFVIGKSTNAREGLQIEAAGLIDPGFQGNITLELKNLHHDDPVNLVIGDPIGQVYFLYTDFPVDVPYGPENGNHYQGQRGVTMSHRLSAATPSNQPALFG